MGADDYAGAAWRSSVYFRRSTSGTDVSAPLSSERQTLRALSLGAGVQSSALALMIEAREIAPVDFAVFAANPNGQFRLARDGGFLRRGWEGRLRPDRASGYR